MSDFTRLEDCINNRIQIEETFLKVLKAFKAKKHDEVMRLEVSLKKLHEDMYHYTRLLQQDDDFQALCKEYNETKKSAKEKK